MKGFPTLELKKGDDFFSIFFVWAGCMNLHPPKTNLDTKNAHRFRFETIIC